MKIEQDEFRQDFNEKKGPSTVTIVSILIAATIIAVIVIIVAIMSMSGKDFSVSINEATVTGLAEDTFVFTEDGKIYISIKDIAPFVGYESHIGEYKEDLQDLNKMYVEATDGTETTSFYLNSTTISKVKPNTNNDYEYITITEPVIMMNDKMYIISDGFIPAFNTLFAYDKTNNRAVLQTLPYLVAGYSSIIERFGYTSLSTNFNNQKALIYGMIVASKSNNGNYGVVSTTGEEILSPRYDDIEFVESVGEFIITNSSSKVGIAYNTGKTKITVSYDDIKVIDSISGLYLVKSNGKYGIVDSTEKTILHMEYDQIGVDVSKFEADNIKNQYILYDKIIPALINGKWRLFDTTGKRLVDDEYMEVGYRLSSVRNAVESNALTIADTKTIIVGKLNEEGDLVYGGVDVKGNELIPIRFEAIYSITNAGKTTYYIFYNNTEYNAVEFIDVRKEQLGYKEDENELLQTSPLSGTINNDTNSVERNEITENIDVTNVIELNTVEHTVTTPANETNSVSANEIVHDINQV